MKKICEHGFKVSNSDKKAFEHYVLEPMAAWSNSALRGMANKAVKTILRDYLELYKSKQVGSISASYAIIIPAIVTMPEFKPYNHDIPEMPIINRKGAKTEEIWEGGFQVEDYEKIALDVYYSDPESMLEYFMENKIYQRRKAFVKEYETAMFKDPTVTEIPAHQDDFIDLVTAKAGYKNRIQSED